MQRVKSIVIKGYGINCEKEMAMALEMAGSEVSQIHAEKLFEDEFPWAKAQLICFPGGFSFGDELGAAKAFANRINYHTMQIRHRLEDFVDKGNCLFGICNGFQLLVKLGLLPDNLSSSNQVSLTHNQGGRFENRWVYHKVCHSPCVFTKGLDSLYLPVRHGEGKLVGQPSHIANLFQNQRVVLQYSNADGSVAEHFPANPNGSMEAIGGLCDATGRIFGMMAHPEAAIHFTNDPRWTRLKDNLQRKKESLPKNGPGFAIFQNVINYLKDSQ